ncbi:B3 domain-containing protein [Dendrobium catenatum]|uniref:B3 domain-containing protein n=1 Tax=Dendrobium catenatum TaxID=906689 RepID=A0A2I0WMV3_9ASPA|nr:B3 domain-containing protein [Dendrobium catenatum]
MNYKKRPIFEKPLVTSDFGKMNMAVIAKTYVEKYFPLDVKAGENDLLVSFEDDAEQLILAVTYY